MQTSEQADVYNEAILNELKSPFKPGGGHELRIRKLSRAHPPCKLHWVQSSPADRPVVFQTGQSPPTHHNFLPHGRAQVCSRLSVPSCYLIPFSYQIRTELPQPDVFSPAFRTGEYPLLQTSS